MGKEFAGKGVCEARTNAVGRRRVGQARAGETDEKITVVVKH